MKDSYVGSMQYIVAKTEMQKAALKCAAGWVRCPNGDAGMAYPREILEIFYRHNAIKSKDGHGRYTAIDYWPNGLWKDLAAFAASKGSRDPWPAWTPCACPHLREPDMRGPFHQWREMQSMRLPIGARAPKGWIKIAELGAPHYHPSVLWGTPAYKDNLGKLAA